MQVYVVVSQPNIMSSITPNGPVAAYLDYPSALAFAKTIFKPTMSFNGQTARDLVFLINVSDSSSTPASGTSGTPTIVTNSTIPDPTTG